MSTRLVLGAVGAVVGAYFGNPQLGWAIGSAIGGAVDPEIIKGPSIGDIVEQTSLEGGPRPIFFARSPPIAGNIIAKSEPRIVRRRESQGKGGPKVETESVYRTYAVGVGEGPIGGFVRVWRNGTLVYDATSEAMNTDDERTILGDTIILPSANAGFLARARFFLGTYDQMPSPDLETVLGVGTTPAHRGTAYMVMADEDLTDLRGAIPQWTFQVQRCGVSQPMIVSVSSSGPDGNHQVMRSLDGENFELQETPINVGAPIAGFTWSGLVHAPALGLLVAVNEDGASSVMVCEDNAETWELVDTGLAEGQWRAVAWSPTLRLLAAVRPHATHAIMTSPDGRNWTLQPTPTTFIGGQCIIWCDGSDSFIAGSVNNGTNEIITSVNGETWIARTTPVNNAISELASKGLHVIGVDRGDLNIIESLDGGVTWAQEASGVAFGLGDIAFSTDNNRCVAVSGTGSAGISDNFSPFDPFAMPTTDAEGVCYSAAFGGFYATHHAGGAIGSRVSRLPVGSTTFALVPTPANCDAGFWEKVIAVEQSIADECEMTVAQIIQEICDRAGLPAELIDVSELEETFCRGFMVVNQYPCFTALRSLSEVFLFDPSSFDGRVHFRVRGANSVATVTEDDMLDDEQDIQQARRSDAISIPRVLHLNYHDIAGGIATDKQSSERSGDRRSVGEASIQTAVLLNANEAARTTAINHKIMIEDQRGELKFCLPDSFIRLTPANNIIVQWQGRSIRSRISKIDINDGYQEYLLLHDRQSAYTSNVEGIPAAPQTPPKSTVVGPTLIQPLDIHILRDADDSVGLSYYVAVSGVLEAWQGALVELSLDGGENYTDSSSTRISAVMGELITALDDHPQAFVDEVHSVTVRIDTPLAELAETDLVGMLNGANLAIIGDELIQFANADEVVPGTWQLSLLLRGRKGSTTASHPAGTRFVLLAVDTVHLIPASLSDIGRTLTFRATSFGNAVEDGTVVSMVYTGRSQIEREPAYVAARREGADVIVTWQGVGRLGSGVTVAHAARFAGYRVTFDDGSLDESVDTDEQQLTHDVSAYGSPLSIRVAQLNELTGVGPFIEVILT